MILRILLLLLITFAPSAISAQESPYNFNWKKDLVYASGAGLLTAGGIFADYQTRPLTEAQINSLDPYELSGIDRLVMNNWSPKADLASDVLMYSSITLPAFMMINKRARKDFLVVGFIYAETAMLTIGVTQLFKAGIKRPRPYVYNDAISLNEKMKMKARFSFISGHTSFTTALCFTTAKIFSDYSDNPTHEALVWTSAAILPIATAALRIEAGKHFPTDVIGGYIVGGAIGYLVPWLHRKKPIVKGMTISPYGIDGGAGVYFSYRL